MSRSEREGLQRLVEELKAQLQQQKHGSLPRSLKMGGAMGGARYWQVTDIDDAIAQHKKVEKTEQVNGVADASPGDDEATPTATPTQPPGLGEWELGEEPEAMTSQLMSMLESQVSKLDKQLE